MTVGISEMVLNYDFDYYDFHKKISDLIKCDLKNFHKFYDSGDYNIWMGGESVTSDKNGIINLVNIVYDFFRTNDEFKFLWNDFCKNFIKKFFFDDEPIIIQRLPSVKIVPSKKTLIYSDYVMQNGVKINSHRDGDPPWSHPKFEVNFWMPLTNTDEYNTLHIENESHILMPKILQLGNVLRFNGNSLHHGSRVFNESNFSRFSLDFRACNYREYDSNKLSNIKIKSRGKIFKQCDYYNTNNFYMKVF